VIVAVPRPEARASRDPRGALRNWRLARGLQNSLCGTTPKKLRALQPLNPSIEFEETL